MPLLLRVATCVHSVRFDVLALRSSLQNQACVDPRCRLVLGEEPMSLHGAFQLQKTAAAVMGIELEHSGGVVPLLSSLVCSPHSTMHPHAGPLQARILHSYFEIVARGTHEF